MKFSRVDGGTVDDILDLRNGRNLFDGRGERSDMIVAGGSSADILVFAGDLTHNGRWDPARITDFVLRTDSLVFGEDAVAVVRTIGDSIFLPLDSNDRDILIIRGAGGVTETCDLFVGTGPLVLPVPPLRSTIHSQGSCGPATK